MNNLSLTTAILTSLAITMLGACTTMKKAPNYNHAGPMKTSSATVNESDCGPGIMPVAEYMIDNNGSPAEAIKIRVTGYGAPPKSFYPDAQRRLMAMRAAKIDAYRNLAERVTGVQIWGGTTIGDMVVEKDRFRVYLDTHISGARVIAENPQEDGTYESVVELKLGQSFLQQALPKKVSNDCAPAATSPFRLTSVDKSMRPIDVEKVEAEQQKIAEKEKEKEKKNLIPASFYFSRI